MAMRVSFSYPRETPCDTRATSWKPSGFESLSVSSHPVQSFSWSPLFSLSWDVVPVGLAGQCVYDVFLFCFEIVSLAACHPRENAILHAPGHPRTYGLSHGQRVVSRPRGMLTPFSL